MISTLFAYDGCAVRQLHGGRGQDPGRNLPRSIILGVLIVIVDLRERQPGVHLTCWARRAIATSERVAADAMSAMVGRRWAPRSSSFAILCSTFGALSANVLAGPRVFFAMARDGLFFSAARDHSRDVRDAVDGDMGARRLGGFC